MLYMSRVFCKRDLCSIAPALTPCWAEVMIQRLQTLFCIHICLAVLNVKACKQCLTLFGICCSIKQNYRDVILFFKVGKFYELYEDDAQIGADALEWKMTITGVGHCRQVREIDHLLFM